MADAGRMVELVPGDDLKRGYLAGVDEGADRPGLILVHEWWGLTEHILGIADRFGEAGFIVLAPDLYEGKVTKDAEEAGRLMQSLDQQRALAILDAAVAYLQQ